MSRIVVLYDRAECGDDGDQVFRRLRERFTEVDVSSNELLAGRRDGDELRKHLKQSAVIVTVGAESFYDPGPLRFFGPVSRFGVAKKKSVIRILTKARVPPGSRDAFEVTFPSLFLPRMERVEQRITNILNPTGISRWSMEMLCTTLFAFLAVSLLYILFTRTSLVFPEYATVAAVPPPAAPVTKPVPEPSVYPIDKPLPKRDAEPILKPKPTRTHEVIHEAVLAGEDIGIDLVRTGGATIELVEKYENAIAFLAVLPADEVVSRANEIDYRTKPHRAKVAQLVATHAQAQSTGTGTGLSFWSDQLAEVAHPHVK